MSVFACRHGTTYTLSSSPSAPVLYYDPFVVPERISKWPVFEPKLIIVKVLIHTKGGPQRPQGGCH